MLVVNSDNTISVLGDSSVGPYDGNDDTLVGILNNSSSPVPAITVSGPGSGLAGFDGDGICTYAAGGISNLNGPGFAGDSYCDAQQLAGTDPEDYAGPDNSYTLDPNSLDDVEVDFAGTGLAPGSTTYFSLEGALTAAAITARKGTLIPSSTAPNWAGYVSQNPLPDPISAQVTLPEVTCNVAGEAAFWVGYDGYEKGSDTVEQDGVSASCDRVGGTPSFFLWYELYNERNINPFANIDPVEVDRGVHLQAGDTVDMFVNIITPDTFFGIPLGKDGVFFSLSAYDAAGKPLMKTWSKTIPEPLLFDPKYNSSECIAEAPTDASSHQQIGLPDFGTVNFANCSAIDDVVSRLSDLVRLDMVNHGTTLATTTVFGRNENGENYFSVNWVASN